MLGDHVDIVEYIAGRIGYDVATTKFILAKHPSVYNVRVTKVCRPVSFNCRCINLTIFQIKEIMDYILNETEFTSHDIAKVPRILCHSLETTRQRLDELKSHGCHPTTLVIVCKSINEYQKFLNQWLSVRKKLIERKKLKVEVK